MSISLDPEKAEGSHVGKIWTQLFGLVLWFATTYGQFLNFRLELSATTRHSDVVVGLGALVSAVVIALTLRAPSVFPRTRKIQFWYYSSALLVVAFLALVLLYQELGYLWTCQSSVGPALLKGSVATPRLSEFLAHGGDACSAFEQFPGSSTALYEPSSLWSRYQLLGCVYIFAWVLLAALIISVANCFKMKRGL
jgi:hypothetical protein